MESTSNHDIFDNNHKPIFKRLETWLVLTFILVIGVIIKFTFDGIDYLKQEEYFTVKLEDIYYTNSTRVDRFQTIRKSDRPSYDTNCYWDLDRSSYEVCVEYTCVKKDSLKNCIEEECAAWETRYKYSYNTMSWRKYNTYTHSSTDSSHKVKYFRSPYFSDRRVYRYVDNTTKFYVVFTDPIKKVSKKLSIKKGVYDYLLDKDSVLLVSKNLRPWKIVIK